MYLCGVCGEKKYQFPCSFLTIWCFYSCSENKKNSLEISLANDATVLWSHWGQFVSTQTPVVMTRQTVQPGCDCGSNKCPGTDTVVWCRWSEVDWQCHEHGKEGGRCQFDGWLMQDCSALSSPYIFSSVLLPTDHIVFCKLWCEEKSVWR